MSKNDKIKQKELGKLWIPVVCVLLGVGLLLMGSMSKHNATEEGTVQAFRYENLDPADYAARVEEQVASICSGVRGAGRARAVVTLSGGYRAIYATDSHTDSSGYKNEIVLVGNGSEEEAVLLGYENPEIGGIGIICEGGDDPNVQKEIISLVSATYHISTARIYVVSGNVS